MVAESDPVVLSEAAEKELAEATAEHVQAMKDPAAEPSAASRKRTAPGEEPRAVAASFQAKLGVQELCKVKRRGTFCMFCDGELAKNGWKFTVAWKKNKPCKSMHVACVAAMDRDSAENSVSVLQHLQRGAEVSAEEREIFEQAVASLQERLTTAASGN